MKNINTLEALADMINSADEYNATQVESICEENGWTLGADEWHICQSANEQIIFNDNGIAEVIAL